MVTGLCIVCVSVLPYVCLSRPVPASNVSYGMFISHDNNKHQKSNDQMSRSQLTNAMRVEIARRAAYRVGYRGRIFVIIPVKLALASPAIGNWGTPPLELTHSHRFGNFQLSSLLYLCRNLCDFFLISWACKPWPPGDATASERNDYFGSWPATTCWKTPIPAACLPWTTSGEDTNLPSAVNAFIATLNWPSCVTYTCTQYWTLSRLQY